MFGVKKKGPTQPFIHADNCRIVKADPGVGIPWNYEGAGSGRQSACTRSSTSVSPSPTTMFGSTRTTRRPHVISGSESTSLRPILP
jgi:hypothetical protein